MLAALLTLVLVASSALCAWQVERRAWKLRLIAAVEARSHRPAVPAPDPRTWRRLSNEGDSYTRVYVTGRFDHAREVRVTAVTGRGEGYWLVTPFSTQAGWTVLVNRGFLPAGMTNASRPGGLVVVKGLLRMTEPDGQFLRPNRPELNRWYSRDVQAISAARGLRDVAPYFIDADAAPSPSGYPAGGLTVVTFRNEHLSYAITWLALAGMSACGLWFVLRERSWTRHS